MANRDIKAILIHFDPVENSIKIESSRGMPLPERALTIVSLDVREMRELERAEFDRRFSGTIIGVLELLSETKLLSAPDETVSG